jgi:hypothetical protein
MAKSYEQKKAFHEGALVGLATLQLGVDTLPDFMLNRMTMNGLIANAMTMMREHAQKEGIDLDDVTR